MYRLLSVTFLGLVLVASHVGFARAQTQDLPPITSRADSIAYRTYEALGGPDAWQSVNYLRFTFAIESEGNRRPIAHHLWNRRTGDYRVEWSSQEGDTTFVVLFNINTQEGDAYANAEAVSGERSADLLQQAYRRYINDTYWMLAPVKLLDEGVNRTYLPDSSTTETAVLHITFGNVGLTPGDQYWHYIDRETNRTRRWAYHLQGYSDDQSPSNFRWMNYEQFETPEGPIWIATRKEALDASRAILTDRIEVSGDVPDDMFSDPNPRL